MDQILLREAHCYQGVLIQHQSYHDNYVCPQGGATISGGDGMDFSTLVPAVRSAWVHAALPYHARHSVPLPSVDPTPIAFFDIESPRVWLPGGTF
jgi:hypothetical protein